MLSTRAYTVLSAVCTSVILAACSGYSPPSPSPLQANPATSPASVLWSHKLGSAAQFPIQLASQGGQLLVADGSGLVQALNASTGSMLWSAQAGKPLSAGIGFDGNTTAVVTQDAQLLAFSNGSLLWKAPLQSQTYTPPLVSEGKVFVLGSDQSITAFDAKNGRKLWQHTSRLPKGSLVLQQPSLLMVANNSLLIGANNRTVRLNTTDTLFVGVNGRIVRLNTSNGAPLGETVLNKPRSDAAIYSQIMDLHTPASLQGNSLCARTYQTSVSCIGLTGALAWIQPSNGFTGVAGDAQMVIGTDYTGTVVSWSRTDGKVLWKNTSLQHRNLTAPLLVGNNIIIGDGQGFVHILDRANGNLRNRLSIHTSAIYSAPVLAGNTVVVISKEGVVAGLQVQ